MNIYSLIIVAVSLAVLLGCMINGYNRGLTKGLLGAVSLLASAGTVLLAAGMIRERSGAAGIITGLILLIVLRLVYGIVKALLKSLHLFARLPVISWVDSLLGLVLGLLEGFAYLYIMEYVLRYYILV